MEYKVIVLESASVQISEQVDYILKISGSRDFARHWAEEAMRAIFGLNVFPRRYPESEIKALKEKGIRRMPVKNRIAYYYVDEEEKAVKICAFIFSGRDQGTATAEIKTDKD